MSNIELASKDYVDSKGGSSFAFISEEQDNSILKLGIGEDTPGELGRKAEKIKIGGDESRSVQIAANDTVRICSGEEMTDMWDAELTLDSDGIVMKTKWGNEYFSANTDKIILGLDGNTTVFCNGPLYDKDGNEITAGGGGGGSSASTVWQVLFEQQGSRNTPWQMLANELRDNLVSIGLRAAFMNGEWYGTSDWTTIDSKMFPITFWFGSPVTLAQLDAATPGMIGLIAAAPMQTP